MFKWLTKLFKDNNPIPKKYRNVHYRYTSYVETLDDLYNSYLMEELYIGKLIYVKSEDCLYMLKSLEYTNSGDIKDCWIKFTEKKLNENKTYTVSTLGLPNICYDKDGNQINFDKSPHLRNFMAKGHNFEHRNLYNNDIFTVNIIREPKENDIVMDLNYKLWEVKNIENGLYNLTRKDNCRRTVNKDEIYGVVQYSWNVGGR